MIFFKVLLHRNPPDLHLKYNSKIALPNVTLATYHNEIRFLIFRTYILRESIFTCFAKMFCSKFENEKVIYIRILIHNCICENQFHSNIFPYFKIAIIFPNHKTNLNIKVLFNFIALKKFNKNLMCIYFGLNVKFIIHTTEYLYSYTQIWHSVI